MNKISEYEDILHHKQSALDDLSSAKHELTLDLSTLQNNFERYTELVRETSVYVETEKESEKIKALNGEIDSLKKQVSRINERNKTLEEEVLYLNQREVNFKSEITVLNQQASELERLLNTISQSNKKEKTERICSDNLDLNFDHYNSRLFTELESRKESNLFDNQASNKIQIDEEEHYIENNDKLSMRKESFIKERVEFPTIEKVKPKPNYMFEESVSVMYPQISMILKKKESFEYPTQRLYAEFVYICYDKYKMSRLLVAENKKLFIFKNRTTRKPELEIALESVTSIIVSKELTQVYEITYKNAKAVEEKLVLENYTSTSFFEFISDNQNFDVSRKKFGDVVLASKDYFKNAICNIYRSVKKAGFLEQLDVGNSWGNWNLAFLIRLDNVVTIFPAPEKFFYDKFEGYRKNAQLIRMDNYNVFNNGKNTGYKKENLFYVKIRNENRDLILSSASVDEKRSWIHGLSE